MKLTNSLNDQAALAELGKRIAHYRVESGITQARLAEEAGIAKRTLERLESGNSVQLTSLIRVLRTLSLLDHLEAIIPPATPGPMDLLERGGKIRQRARSTQTGDKQTGKPWQWGEDA